MINNGDLVEFIKQKDYIMINNNLGSGSFGKTVLLKDPFIDELFVAKKYEPYYEGDRKAFYNSFLQEIKIMYKLYHPNVVRVFNYYPYESLYTGYIIMEYIDGMRIDEYFNSCFYNGKEINTDNIFLQLIDGFDYIERQGVVHRDIRSGNILITSDGTVKIIDFGLGKTFSPVEVDDDSMAEIINRSGLDCLPEEFFEGIYNSKTDMFYLAELFNRIVQQTDAGYFFSYDSILQKMLEIKPENRFKSFAEIKETISKRDFFTLEIDEKDKVIYQEFSNAIFNNLDSFKSEPKFVKDIDEFNDNLKNVMQKNCFEENIQDISDLISSLVKSGFKYMKNRHVSCDVLKAFYDWFNNLSVDSQKLVINNMIYKVSTIKVSTPDDLPF